MKIAESKAEIYLMALESLSKAEKKAIIAHLLEDETLREDILDIALIQNRKGEPSRPLREYLTERTYPCHCETIPPQRKAKQSGKVR